MRRPYAYPDAYGTHATQSPLRRDDARARGRARLRPRRTARSRARARRPLRARARAGRTGSRRSGRADDRSSRRPRARGSRTRARTRPRVGRGASVVRSAQRSTTLRTCADGQRRQRLVVVGREQHDLARADRGHARGAGGLGGDEVDRVAGRERGPTIREPAHVVRVGRFEPADAERASGRRAGSGAPADAPTMLTHSRVSGSKRNSPAGPVIVAIRRRGQPRTAGMTSAAKRSSPSRSNGARKREDHVRRARVDVRADLVDHLRDAAREHARLHRVRPSDRTGAAAPRR